VGVLLLTALLLLSPFSHVLFLQLHEVDKRLGEGHNENKEIVRKLMAMNWIVLYNEPFSTKREIIYYLCP